MQPDTEKSQPWGVLLVEGPQGFSVLFFLFPYTSLFCDLRVFQNR